MAALRYGEVEAMVVEGVAEGSFFRADLFQYTSEDSTTHEFRAEMLSEQEAKDLVAFWSTGGHGMVRAAASCRMPHMEGADEPASVEDVMAEFGLSDEEWDALPVKVRRYLCGMPPDCEIDTDAEREPFNHNLIR